MLIRSMKESWPRLAAQAAGIALVMALIGPFGQAQRFLPSHRLGLWLLYLAAGLPLLILIVVGVRRRVRPSGLAWSAGVIVLSTLLASPPILALVEGIGLIEGRPLPATPNDYVRSVFQVALLALPFAAVVDRSLYSPRRAGVADIYKAAPFPAAAPVSPVVPAEMPSGEIHAFCAEGHYTRLFMAQGERFMDRAFSEMLDASRSFDGTQVHRSWWVARAAVEGTHRKGSSIELKLKGGLSVPVARRRLTALRKQGWTV